MKTSMNEHVQVSNGTTNERTAAITNPIRAIRTKTGHEKYIKYLNLIKLHQTVKITPTKAMQLKAIYSP